MPKKKKTKWILDSVESVFDMRLGFVLIRIGAHKKGNEARRLYAGCKVACGIDIDKLPPDHAGAGGQDKKLQAGRRYERAWRNEGER